MRLLPAMIFVTIIFVAGLFFLQGRSVLRRTGFLSDLSPGQKRRTALLLAVIALATLLALFFTLLGKLAIVIALAALAVFFLSSRRR